jgi:hypothetical protein
MESTTVTIQRSMRASRLNPLAAALALAIAASTPAVAMSLAPSQRLDAPAVRTGIDATDRPRPRFPHANPVFARLERPDGGPPIVVTSCDDAGPGTLREAYFNAVDGDVIDLSQLTCSEISLTTGALTDSAPEVSIEGAGKYALTINGNNNGRVLVHNGSGTLTVYGLTISGGSYSGQYGGGCIYSYGNVLLEAANVSSCSLSSSGTDHAYGGAVYAKNSVLLAGAAITESSAHAASANSAGGGVWAYNAQIYFSTVSGNTISGDGSHYSRGGGAFVRGDARIGYSTFAGNAAESGGAIFLFGGATDTMVIANSTISGNHASGAGGGVFAKYRPLEVDNSTISGNTAVFDFGAGLYLYTDTDIESTIVAGNTSQDGLLASDVGGAASITITGANNLIVAPTLPVPADTISADPMLGPLQDNGGVTMTHALLPGSPAIDQGNNIRGFSYDQRVSDETAPYGYERMVGANADIGAFEFGAPDRIFVGDFDF